jgi:hypothetical protein
MASIGHAALLAAVELGHALTAAGPLLLVDRGSLALWAPGLAAAAAAAAAAGGGGGGPHGWLRSLLCS